MSTTSCIEIETEDIFASCKPCVMLRLQPICVFKYVISDSRWYHTHFSKDPWDPMRPPASLLNLQKVAGIPIVKLCSRAIKSYRICGEKKVCLLISGSSQTHEQTRFPHHTALLCVWDFAVSLPRNGRFSTVFSLLFHLPRCMVSTARLVLVLRRHSRNLQQEWCPTKLYKLLQPTPHQQQQPVQLKTRSRVTECRETWSHHSSLRLYFIFQSLTIFPKSLDQNSHSMFVSSAAVHG